MQSKKPPPVPERSKVKSIKTKGKSKNRPVGERSRALVETLEGTAHRAIHLTQPSPQGEGQGLPILSGLPTSKQRSN